MAWDAVASLPGILSLLHRTPLAVQRTELILKGGCKRTGTPVNTMSRYGLGALAAAALLGLSMIAGPQVQAKTKSACNAIKDMTACKANATCSWVSASIDKATGKQKRRAYCRTKPKRKPKAPKK